MFSFNRITIEVQSLNIKIAKGAKDGLSSENEYDAEFLNSNSSLEHFELKMNNLKDNFKDIKLNEEKRKNEKVNKDSDDGILMMKKISSQYATSYDQNVY